MHPVELKSILGFVTKPHRVFVYIEHERGTTLKSQEKELYAVIDRFRALKECPSDGSVGTDNTVIYLPTGEVYIGYTYRGDLAGWGRIVDAYCQERGRRTAQIQADGSVVISDGRTYTFHECEIITDIELSYRIPKLPRKKGSS
ncbi:MAG TPA: hypothetical protein PKC45_14935 [Gemmatales bacterium]|nr:hypothetical protein [Gemmatales bacterium]